MVDAVHAAAGGTRRTTRPGVRVGALLMIGAALSNGALAGTAAADGRWPAGSAPSAFAAAVPGRFRLPREPGWTLYGSTSPPPQYPGPYVAEVEVPSALGGLRVTGNRWGQLRDARGFDGLRLFNLWHGRNNALSLQAGRRGEATLQWTSHPFGAARDERGVFDRLFDLTPADGR